MHCGKIVYVQHKLSFCWSHFSTYCLGRFFWRCFFLTSLGMRFTVPARKENICFAPNWCEWNQLFSFPRMCVPWILLFLFGELPDKYRRVHHLSRERTINLFFFIFFSFMFDRLLALSLFLPWGGLRMTQNAEWWMSQLPHRWRTQQTAKRNAICRTRESSNFWTQVALAGNPASMSVWVSLGKKH